MRPKDLDIDRISRAFSPSTEIDNPELFAGRKEEIKAGIRALVNRGGFLAIHGLRGVGKSSIAVQIKLIAEGDTRLVKMLNLERLMPKRGFNFIVRYFKTDTFIKSSADLLKRILFGDDKNSSLFSLTKAGDRRLEEFKKVSSFGGEIGIGIAKLAPQAREESTFRQYVADDVIQQFRALLGTIQRDNQDKTGLLILIDEFDRIPSKDDFASIVKACSSDYVHFGVVGIATTITELIRDHSSIGRQIDSVRVPIMPPNELAEILHRAEFVIGQSIMFDTDAVDAITARSEGFPFFTHLLGREAMLLAFDRNSSRVTREDIEVLAQRITHGNLPCIYEDMYHEAVKNSPQREVLLKIFSDKAEDEILTEDVYGLAKELGITNPSQLMKQLTTPDNPDAASVLIRVRDRYYRFSDPVFKTYARLRRWKHE